MLYLPAVAVETTGIEDDMSHQTCDRCKVAVYRKVYETNAEGKFVGLGVDCGCKRVAVIKKAQTNSFCLTLDHVADEFGQKLHVENLRQLSAAEKRYGFQSVVLNSDAQNFDDPPQQRKIEVADIHRFKYGSRESYKRRFA